MRNGKGRFKVLGEDWVENHELGSQVLFNDNYVIYLKVNKRKEDSPREKENLSSIA